MGPAVDCPEYPSSDWISSCPLAKVDQVEDYGCGIACLTMVAGGEYATARALFVKAGMAQKRGGRAPFSTNLSELSATLTVAGLANVPRKWNGWHQFRGLGIIKVRYRLPTAGKGWHWAVAFTHDEYQIVVFDPHCPMPAFKRMPMNVECCNFEVFEVVGKWLQVENIHHGQIDV